MVVSRSHRIPLFEEFLPKLHLENDLYVNVHGSSIHND